MSGRSLMDFQAQAVSDGAAPLMKCLRNIRLARGFSAPEEQLDFVRERQGALLVNAPTGIGKTLIAGGIVEELCEAHKMVWLWFAPFTGIVEQSVRVIGREFPGCSRCGPALTAGLKTCGAEMSMCPLGAALRPATRTDAKSGRTGTFRPLTACWKTPAPTAYEVGLMIDEAHHSFRENTEAHKFCRDVLKPVVSVMLTATPREGEIKRLAESLGAKEFSRIEISRETGIEKGLLKRGVRAALFRAAFPAKSHIVDFKRVALAEALRAHWGHPEVADGIGRGGFAPADGASGRKPQRRGRCKADIDGIGNAGGIRARSHGE